MQKRRVNSKKGAVREKRLYQVSHREDSTLGCEELIAHSRVSRLSNDVFCIPWSSLALLDARRSSTRLPMKTI